LVLETDKIKIEIAQKCYEKLYYQISGTIQHIGFGVVTMVIMHVAIFWDIASETSVHVWTTGRCPRRWQYPFSSSQVVK
jgi:hypothetical protein